MNTRDSTDQVHGRGGCCCSGKKLTPGNTQDIAGSMDHSVPLQRIWVRGATCSGCVKSIENAICSLPGVKEVSMDLSTGLVNVVGVVDGKSVIDAIYRKGYAVESLDW